MFCSTIQRAVFDRQSMSPAVGLAWEAVTLPCPYPPLDSLLADDSDCSTDDHDFAIGGYVDVTAIDHFDLSKAIVVPSMVNVCPSTAIFFLLTVTDVDDDRVIAYDRRDLEWASSDDPIVSTISMKATVFSIDVVWDSSRQAAHQQRPAA